MAEPETECQHTDGPETHSDAESEGGEERWEDARAGDGHHTHHRPGHAHARVPSHESAPPARGSAAPPSTPGSSDRSPASSASSSAARCEGRVSRRRSSAAEASPYDPAYAPLPLTVRPAHGLVTPLPALARHAHTHRHARRQRSRDRSPTPTSNTSRRTLEMVGQLFRGRYALLTAVFLAGAGAAIWLCTYYNKNCTP